MQNKFADVCLSPKDPQSPGSTVDVPTKIAALRRVLGFWLDFLERETWYVRRAFYVGMIPLLTAAGGGISARKFPRSNQSDLLFLDIRELVAGIADPAVIHTRRRRYMENSEYLSSRGVDPSRLATMLRSS